MSRPDESDLLLGCSAITEFLNELLAPKKKISQAAVYRLIEGQKIPTGRLGSRVVGSRRIIRERLERLASGGAGEGERTLAQEASVGFKGQPRSGGS